MIFYNPKEKDTKIHLRRKSMIITLKESYFLKDFIYLFLDRGEGRERERNINQLPRAHPQLGTWTATQACGLNGNRTGNLSVHRPALNPLSHTS